MQHFTRDCFLVAVLGVWLYPTPARAADASIQDVAGIFAAETIQTAEGILADVQRRFEMEVVIETFKEIPADRKAQYSPAQAAEFFETWARERANSRKVRGVYMLICMNPRQAQIGTDRAATRRAFTPDNRRQLMDTLREKFKKNEFDAGLLTGLEYVRHTVAANLKP